MKTWLQRYRHLRSADVAVLALNSISWSGAVLLSVLQFGQPSIGHWLVGAVVAVTASVAAAEALVRSNVVRDAEERRKRQQLARSLIEDLCAAAIQEMSADPERTGCVIFLPDSLDDPKWLETAFTYNKEGAPDRDLKFVPLQGCTGHAWVMRRQTVARLSEVDAAELEQTWKLTPEQIRLTQHLKVVVSTPIWGWDDSNRLVGVVSVDCQADDSVCRLSSPESLNEALELAALVARILSLADLV